MFEEGTFVKTNRTIRQDSCYIPKNSILEVIEDLASRVLVKHLATNNTFNISKKDVIKYKGLVQLNKYKRYIKVGDIVEYKHYLYSRTGVIIVSKRGIVDKVSTYNYYVIDTENDGDTQSIPRKGGDIKKLYDVMDLDKSHLPKWL